MRYYKNKSSPHCGELLSFTGYMLAAAKRAAASTDNGTGN